MIVCEGLHMAKLTPKSYMCYHAVFSPVRINGPHHTHIRRCMYYNSVVMFSLSDEYSETSPEPKVVRLIAYAMMTPF